MKNVKTIEVEARGPLTKQQYEELCQTLEKEGQFQEEERRLLIDYSTFLTGQATDQRTRDIRLRVTNKIPEIIVKLGKWSATDQREELAVTVRAGEFDTLVRIFAAMGLTKGMLCERRGKIYIYGGAQFKVVEVPQHSFYFEVEQLAGSPEDVPAIHSHLHAVCKELNLQLFSDKQFYDYIDALNRETNELFDFDRDYQPGYFANRFHLDP